MTKDRLPALHALRYQQDKNKKLENIRVLFTKIKCRARNVEDSNPDGAYVTLNIDDTNRFMSDFFSRIDSLRTNINKISELVDEVKCLDPTMLIAAQANNRAKEELEEKMTHIRKIANDVRLKLQAERSMTNQEVEEILESENSVVFTEDMVIETAEDKQSLADIEARHGDIMKLEKDVRELHDIFIDMAELVGTQDEMFNQIEYNVVQTEDFMGGANDRIVGTVLITHASRWVSFNNNKK
ncbi:unnamed protein product [Rotaria sp. Silwood2]|nr:unnamed protein product [Rotaria sp. Silwood2]